MATVNVTYKKENEAKKVIIVIDADDTMSMLDVVRALITIANGILTSGKY